MRYTIGSINLQSKFKTEAKANQIAGYIIVDRAYQRLDSRVACDPAGNVLLDTMSSLADEMDIDTFLLASYLSDRLGMEAE